MPGFRQLFFVFVSKEVAAAGHRGATAAANANGNAFGSFLAGWPSESFGLDVADVKLSLVLIKALSSTSELVSGKDVFSGLVRCNFHTDIPNTVIRVGVCFGFMLRTY